MKYHTVWLLGREADIRTKPIPEEFNGEPAFQSVQKAVSDSKHKVGGAYDVEVTSTKDISCSLVAGP